MKALPVPADNPEDQGAGTGAPELRSGSYQGKIPFGVSTEAELSDYREQLARGVYVPEGMSKETIVGVASVVRDFVDVDISTSNAIARAIISFLKGAPST